MTKIWHKLCYYLFTQSDPTIFLGRVQRLSGAYGSEFSVANWSITQVLSIHTKRRPDFARPRPPTFWRRQGRIFCSELIQYAKYAGGRFSAGKTKNRLNEVGKNNGNFENADCLRIKDIWAWKIRLRRRQKVGGRGREKSWRRFMWIDSTYENFTAED